MCEHNEGFLFINGAFDQKDGKVSIHHIKKLNLFRGYVFEIPFKPQIMNYVFPSPTNLSL